MHYIQDIIFSQKCVLRQCPLANSKLFSKLTKMGCSDALFPVVSFPSDSQNSVRPTFNSTVLNVPDLQETNVTSLTTVECDNIAVTKEDSSLGRFNGVVSLNNPVYQPDVGLNRLPNDSLSNSTVFERNDTHPEVLFKASPGSDLRRESDECEIISSSLSSSLADVSDTMCLETSEPSDENTPSYSHVVESSDLSCATVDSPMTNSGDTSFFKKIYKCQSCGKAFARHNSAINHCAVKSKKKSWVCPKCSKEIKQSNNISRHKRRCNKKSILPPVTDSNVIKLCAYCSKNFKNKETLRVHIYNCHNEKRSGDFTCSTCNALFTSKAQLLKHVKIKHGPATIFSCDFCNYTCSSSNGLSRHCRKVHPSKSNPEVSEVTFDGDSNSITQTTMQVASQKSGTEGQNIAHPIESQIWHSIDSEEHGQHDDHSMNTISFTETTYPATLVRSMGRILDFSEF